MPFHVAISRDLAAGLTLVSGPMTALDLSLWLGALGHAFSLEDTPDKDGVTLRDQFATEGVAPVWLHGRTLLQATGMRSHTQLVRPFERLGESFVRIGRPGHGNTQTYRLWEGWEGTPIHRGHEIERAYFPGIPVAYGMIHGRHAPIVVDVEALAAFRSRFSAILFLRALAWMNGANRPSSWGRSTPGDAVTVKVPIDELQEAFGIGSLQGLRSWNDNALGPRGLGGPVHADLASAGVGLRTEWIFFGTGHRKTATGLKITVWSRKPVEKRAERRGRLPRRQLSGSSSQAP